jgi:hypothetical protein
MPKSPIPVEPRYWEWWSYREFREQFRRSWGLCRVFAENVSLVLEILRSIQKPVNWLLAALKAIISVIFFEPQK